MEVFIIHHDADGATIVLKAPGRVDKLFGSLGSAVLQARLYAQGEQALLEIYNADGSLRAAETLLPWTR